MCYNGVVWLSKVCYNVSIADSVYYNKFCIADMLHLLPILSTFYPGVRIVYLCVKEHKSGDEKYFPHQCVEPAL